MVHLRVGETQVERLVVVLDDGEKRRIAAVMVEAALLMRPQSLERRRAIALVRRSVRLEAVDADFVGGVHRPSGLGKERRHMTRRAARRAGEDGLAAIRRTAI